MLSYLRLNSSYALFADQGTGKTIPTLLRIYELLKQGKAHSAIVIAPKAVLGSWTRDIDKFFSEEEKVVLKPLQIVSYDMVWRRKEYFNAFWDIIVLDESHKIKNPQAKRTKAVLKMSLQATYRFILTGTPINNGALENLWSQYCFLAPYQHKSYIYSTFFGGSYNNFLDNFCYLNQWYKPSEYKNVTKFQDIMNQHCYRVKKEECLDLPEKLPDQIFDIELKDRKHYKELHQSSAVLDMDVLAENSLTRMLRLRQFCSGFLEDNEIECEKLNVLEDFLEDWDKKLVIFCEFRKSIDAVDGLLNKMKIKHVILDGRQQDKNIWKKFQSDDRIRVIICQYQSGNAGIDLYSADTILYYEPTLSSNLLEQSRDRIHRIGQTSKCSYIHLLTKGTIEKSIYRALSNYHDFNEKLFNEYMEEYKKGEGV